MNILYTITWPDSNAEAAARALNGKLRACMARGALFPFAGPYEIALVHATAGMAQAAGAAYSAGTPPPRADWAVAVLAMHFTSSEAGAFLASATNAGASTQTVAQLESWFQQCIPEGMPAGAQISPSEATHLRLDSELRQRYEVVESFGTFVGEPEMEEPPAGVEGKASQASAGEEKAPLSPEASPPINPEALPPMISEAEALKTLVEHPIFTEVGLPRSSEAKQVNQEQLRPIPPPAVETRGYSQPPASAGSAENKNTARTCLTVGLVIAGVLVSLGGLVVGALFAFGQYAASPESGSGPMSPGDFALAMACCPAPIFLVGIGLIAAGVVGPRVMGYFRKNERYRG